MDGEKLRLAIREKRCWVCGDTLGRYMTFVIGPMCGINRVSAEPPSHLECAQWSARNCPFLSNAGRQRREDDEINNQNLVDHAPGFAITRNPGVTLLWTTRSYKIFRDQRGGILMRVGDPTAIEFYANGRHATREEIDHSIETGIPTLQAMASQQGEEAELELVVMRNKFQAMLPA